MSLARHVYLRRSRDMVRLQRSKPDFFEWQKIIFQANSQASRHVSPASRPILTKVNVTSA
jgi:hypothetical protein